MLLGQPHIIEARRDFLAEKVGSRPFRHGGADGDDPRIRLGQLHEGLTENLLIRGSCRRRRFQHRAGLDVEFARPVPCIRIFLREFIPLPLFRNNVQKNGAFKRLDIFEDFHQPIDVMTIHTAKIGKPQLFKKHAWEKKYAHAFGHAQQAGAIELNAFQEFLHFMLELFGQTPRQ